MIEKITALTAWATGMAFWPKVVFSVLIILIALLFLLLLWAPKQGLKDGEDAVKKEQHNDPQYIVTVNTFKDTDNKEIRLKLLGAIHSAHINVRDGGPAWESPGKAWEHWQTFISPKLAPSVIESTDVFIVRHNG